MSDDPMYGIDDPDTKAAVHSIRAWARRRLGVDLDWIPVESNIETDMRPKPWWTARG